MAFIEELKPFDLMTTTHYDNFNEQYSKLLENTIFNKQCIGQLEQLQTNVKTDLVKALNELKTSQLTQANIDTTVDIHNTSNTSHNDMRTNINKILSPSVMFEEIPPDQRLQGKLYFKVIQK